MKSEGSRLFPDLDTLVGAYFHQDYDLNGSTIDEVLATYISHVRTEPGIIERARADIARFLATRPDDAELDRDFQRIFDPDISAEGWEDSITNWRLWLTRVAEILDTER